MEVNPIFIELKCLFCDAILQGSEDSKFNSGDLIKCKKCGEENDFDSIIDVAKEKGIEEMTDKVKAEFEKNLKKMFK